MEWHRAKTILIFLFLLVNIFLLSVIINANNKANFDQERLSEVFVKNNINIKPEILPHQKDTIFVSEFYGVTDSIIHFFIPQISKIDGTTYSNDTKTLIVDGNKISYTDSAPADPDFRNVNLKNILSKLEPALKRLGIDSYVVSENISESGGMYLVEYKYNINKHEIFYNKLTFMVSNKGIIKCEGAIYVQDKKNGNSYEINTAETILLQFNKEEAEPLNVISVCLGLYVSDYKNALTIQAIPAYEITTDKRTYIYDARIGVDSNNRELIR